MANDYDISSEIDSIENEQGVLGKVMRVYIANAFKKIQTALGKIPGIVDRWENAEVGDFDSVLGSMQNQINTTNANVSKAQTAADNAQTAANTAQADVDSCAAKIKVVTNTSTTAAGNPGILDIDSANAYLMEFDFGCSNSSNYASKYIEINSTSGNYDIDTSLGTTIGGQLYAGVRLVRNANSTWTAYMTLSARSTSSTFKTESKAVCISSAEITSIRLHTGGTGDTFSNWRCTLRKYY